MSGSNAILCMMVYSTKANLGEFMYEYQAGHGPLHSMGGSQSAHYWARWHSGLSMLGGYGRNKLYMAGFKS